MSEVKRNPREAWLTLIAVAVGLPFAAVVAFFAFVFNVEPLHPDPQAVASVMQSVPLSKWGGAVQQAQQLVRVRLVEQNSPGLSVAVGVAGEIVWAEGFGWANLERREPVGPGTRFRIGHVSKALTSAAVGRLREQGRLHLDDEIQAYVPAYPTKEWPVTLRQLMGHVAGVRHYRNTEWGDKPSVHCERASDGLKSFANDPLLFEPGTQYRYSTYGWVLVSAAVEAAANEPFSTFMRTQIFTPLGMVDTVSEAATEPIPNRVTSYFRRFERETTSDVDYSCFAGAGAFLSTPSDLVRFGFALSAGTFLQPGTVSIFQTRQQLSSGEETDYGLGWMLDSVELAGVRTATVGHSSRTMEGASTSFVTFPERGLVVAVTANISFADPKSIALAVAQVFAAASAAPPAPGRR
jgi:CubicO group peptidase (beta-lactamase class C family)